ncbi:hypothetical protein H0H92_012641 [Tricholoma furcatifolium]|nr:hypothetical protein H0H92_012641 [Tricholoma furcatifolium]
MEAIDNSATSVNRPSRTQGRTTADDFALPNRNRPAGDLFLLYPPPSYVPPRQYRADLNNIVNKYKFRVWQWDDKPEGPQHDITWTSTFYRAFDFHHYTLHAIDYNGV